MRFRPVFAALVGLAVSAPLPAADIVLAVHGGAGTMPRAELSAEREAAVRADLARALRAGHAVIAQGGSSLDAVTRAVVVLEDSPYFNAGKGAVFNHDGVNELDAAIMDGATRRAGAVAGLHRIRNPILLARAVMEKSPHVMMAGEGAEAFAQEHRLRVRRSGVLPHRGALAAAAEGAGGRDRRRPRRRCRPRPISAPWARWRATRKGQLAAATSTGGMTNKRWGRIGDAPIIGAGTYASAQCAVSATGWGEFFIRAAVAHDICARMAYRGDSVRAAAEEVVLKVVPALGGDGGVIALDANGRVAMPFNTEGMYRGTIDADGKVRTAVYRDGD